MVNAMGPKVLNCDGNNVLQVHKILKKAISDTRRGNGPYFLEFFTYRWLEHCGPNFDNDLGYRSEKEFKRWKSREPIRRLKKRIGEKFYKNIKNIEISVRNEIHKAFNFAERSPFPSKSDAYKGIYANK